MNDGSNGAAERGEALVDLGRFAEAERLFREALANDPQSVRLHIGLAHALVEQERYAEARAEAVASLTLEPESVAALSMMGRALAGLGDQGAALHAVRRALQIAPTLAVLHAQESIVLLSNGRAEEALASLQQARSLDPESSGVRALSAAALFELRRYPEAEQAIDAALRLDPFNDEAHRIQGLLALRRGAGPTAVDAHRTALRLDPTDPLHREGLALALKARNPLYGALVRFSLRLQRLPGWVRWAILLAPLVLIRSIQPSLDQWWARTLLILVVAVVTLSWMLDPVMNSVLLLTSFSRNLLPRTARLATYGFLGYLTGAVGAVVWGLTLDEGAALGLAIGLGLWGMTAGRAYLAEERWRKTTVRLHVVGAVLSASAAVALACGASFGGPLTGLVMMTGLAMVWFTALT